MRSSTIPPYGVVSSVYCAAPSLEPVDVVRQHRLQERLRTRPVHVDLAHVRDVERARIAPNRLVLLDDAFVLDGHLVAGERHHARSERDVAIEERRALQRRFHEPRLYCLAPGRKPASAVLTARRSPETAASRTRRQGPSARTVS